MRLVILTFFALFVSCNPPQHVGDDDDAGDDDDDNAAVLDDDDSANPTGNSSIQLNVYQPGGSGTEVVLVSSFNGDQVAACGPLDGGDVVPFHLETDPSLLATMGQLVIRAEGFNTDTTVHPAQALDAEGDGGLYEVYLPDGTNGAYEWVSGTCFLYITSRPEDCFGDPDVLFCGEFSCGSEDDPLLDGAEDEAWMVGVFVCRA